MNIEVLDSEFTNNEIVIHNPATAKESECDWHLHEAYEFIKVIEGQKRIFTLEKEYLLESGDIIFINSRVPHSTKTTAGTTLLLIQSEYNFTKESVYSYLFKQLTMQNDPCFVFKSGTDLNLQLSECIDKIITENIEKKSSYEMFIKASLLNMYAILYRNNILADPQDHFSITHIKKLLPVIEYINENYTEDISLSDVSKLLNIDKSHFCRIFKQAINQSFVQYLNYVRTVNATRLLRSSDKTVSEISLEVGFASSSYFIKEFKEYVGCTPNYYRKIKSENIF